MTIKIRPTILPSCGAAPVILAIAWCSLFATEAQGTEVVVEGYAVSFPNGWHVYTDKALGSVSGCNKTSGKCTGNGGGYPLRGAVFVFIVPGDKAPGHSPFHSVEEIVDSFPHAGQGSPGVSEVNLHREGTKCSVARMLRFSEVWDEVYGLDVGGKLFRVWVQYNDEPGAIGRYRQVIEQILSSVSPRAR